MSTGEKTFASLLPCPFCGEIPQYLATGSVSHPDIIVHRFLCISRFCGVQPFSGWHLTAEKAASVWNKRSPANDKLAPFVAAAKGIPDDWPR